MSVSWDLGDDSPGGKGSLQKRGSGLRSTPGRPAKPHQGPREAPRGFAVAFLDPDALSLSQFCHMLAVGLWVTPLTALCSICRSQDNGNIISASKRRCVRDFPSGPMAKTLYTQGRGSWVQSLVWELRSHMPQLKS